MALGISIGIGVTAIAAAAGAGGAPAVLPSNRQTSTEFSNVIAYTATGGTFAVRRSVLRPFTSGRVIKYSGGAVPASGGRFAVGVASSADPIAQVASGFVPVTWNGANNPVTGGVFSGTGSVNTIEIALSDTFSLSSIARTDGGTGYIAEGREYLANGQTTIYSTAAAQNAGQNIHLATAGGPAYSGFAKSGDFVTTNQSGLTIASLGAHFIFLDLILFGSEDVYTVGVGGDSISRGQFAADGRSNDVRVACDNLTIAGIANVSFSTCARPGAGASTFGPASVEFINKVKPQIFFYTPNSPNDGGMDIGGVATNSTNWLNSVKAACDANGTKLVVCTTVPWAVHLSAADLALRAYNTTLQSWAASNNCPFYDRYTPTTDGNTPAALLVSYQWPTGTVNQKAHPNDTCYQALAPTVETIIRGLIGR